MQRREFLRHSSLLAAGLLLGCNQQVRSGRRRRPNILLIMADDIGYSDIGCYGGEIRTPHLDALAAGGLRFTQFYNAARCCPTRASLLTGLYPHQTGIGHMVYRDKGPGYRVKLNEHCVTLGEVMKGAGYHTMMAGKWHVGHEPGVFPSDRGFERFYGIHKHVDSYFKVLDGCGVYENGKLVIAPTSDPPNELHPNCEWYTTDVFTDQALEMLDQAARTDTPFLLYVAYNSPHWPLEAHDEDIARYRGKYRGGWSEIRRRRYERMREMGILREEWRLPEIDLPDWDALSDDDRDNLDFRRAIYAAQIDRMDQNIGRIIDKLKSQGIFDNTLVLFLSDNGCSAEPESQMFGYRFQQNRVENFERWRKQSGRSSSQGLAWATASNTPFRKYKRWTHEGGIATPLIVHWPDAIKEPGGLTHQRGHVIDIMATCVDVGGATYPNRHQGHGVHQMEGASLVPALRGGQIERAKPLFWEHEGNRAIRQGKWKLVAGGPAGQWELYDLDADRTECNNLAAKYPAKVKDMAETWQHWALERNVLPWPWKPAYPI